jgi:predicted RNA-binding Zn-ribbon protein involved in translation (DUF1610 family)
MSNCAQYGNRVSNTAMTEQEFICSECGQRITINESMREAILANGCPVCAADASDEDFRF